MTVEEVKKIIDEESLKGGNLFEKRENKENEMVIKMCIRDRLIIGNIL